MKTRRSQQFENNFFQSVLFPTKKSERFLNTIVPESPVATCISSASISNIPTASILETPDENFEKNDIRLSRKKTLLSKDDSDDSLVLNETPDLNLKNRKRIISILESEFSDVNTNVGDNDRYNFGTRKSKRKSYAEAILPFDLNDDKTLAKKLAHIEKSSIKRKSLCHNLSKEKKQSLSPSNRVTSLKRKSVLHSKEANNATLLFNTSLDISKNISESNSSFQNINNNNNNINGTTVSFENSDLDITDTKCGNKIFVHCHEEANRHSQASSSNSSVQNASINSSKPANSSEIPNISFKNINISNDKIGHKESTPQRKDFREILEGELSPINRSIFQGSEMFSPTQPASILVLQGVTAVVEVRCGADNRSEAFKDLLLSLGAEVSDKFTAQVTHVIFREGFKATYNKAIQRDVHLVSPLWVEACRVKNVRVSESLFPIKTDLDTGKVPFRRKLRSIQPRSFEEEMELANMRVLKKKKRIENQKKKIDNKYMFPRFPYVSEVPVTPSRSSALTLEEGTSPLYRLANDKVPINESLSSLSGEEISIEEDCSTPLAMRLYNKLIAKPIALDSSPKTGIDSPVSSRQDKEMEIRKDDTSKSSFSSTLNCFPVPSRQDKEREIMSDGPSTSSLSSTLNSSESSFASRLLGNNVQDGSEPSTSTVDMCLMSTRENNANIGTEVSLKSLKVEATKPKRSRPSNIAITNRRRSTRLAAINVVANDDKSHSSIQLEKDIPTDVQKKSSSLPNCSIIPLSAVRRRRLHTVDFTPVQDLIIPSTPPTPLRNRDTGIYDSFKEQNSISQRKEMKRLEGKSSKELAVIPLPRSAKRKVDKNSTDNNIKAKLISCDKLTPVQEGNETPKRTPKGRFSIVPRKRNSVEDFVPRNLRKRISRRKLSPKFSLPSICITGCHSDNIGSLYAIIKSLGEFHITSDVDSNTTHVICGTERRTLNVLLGISRGCWILDVSWLYESVELLKWAPEEPFELFNFCPGAKISRKIRMNKSESFKPTLLEKYGRIFVPESINPPYFVIQDLLLNCGANLCSTLRSADIIIGNEKMDSSLKQVSPKWLFDSIQHWSDQELDNYLL